MDGNRRWAKDRMLPSTFGHKKGVEALKEAVKSCNKFGIKYLTVYAFSTENWNRSTEEVSFLMDLLAKTINTELEELDNNNVKIKFIGNIEILNEKLKKILLHAEKQTIDNTGVKLQIAFNYGARAEITNAIKRISADIKAGTIEINEITEDLISKYLYTSTIPDPDLLIRTGGEQRLSNYLLWQAAYSEILILKEYWPEFSEQTMKFAIEEFCNRNRRYGK